MCGICGSTFDPGAAATRRMCAAMVHRGPNDEGCCEDPTSHATLAARRLSVIDVAGGHQPVSNEDGSIWAVLNGEIYNHPQLQERLRSRGHVLASRTDTEVLVHLYEDYGDALVHALEGMYAFALWDRRRQRLLLGRDRFGEKPLFIWEGGGELAFASELTALAQGLQRALALDAEALDALFVLGYVPGGRTPVRGVRQLPPAHLLTWSRHEPGGAQISRYWSCPARAAVDARSASELLAELRTLLRDAVRSRLIADVPVGVFLSGGLDSTLVATLAREAHGGLMRTFTVGYDVGTVGEESAAERVAKALGSEHCEVRLRSSDIERRVSKVLGAIDAPNADPALIALETVAEAARRSVTVAVGGEGADELFAGYPRYRWLQRAERLHQVLPREAGRLAAGTLRARASGSQMRRLAEVLEPVESAERHLDWVTERRRSLRADLYGPALRAAAGGQALDDVQLLLARCAELPACARFMELDQQRWLPDNVLMKADRASMLNSLEVRTPFLDRALAEFAAAIPADRHSADGGKALLRQLHRQLTGQRLAPAKTAFRVPVADWLSGPLTGLLDHHLNDGRLVTDGWFDRRALQRTLDEHRAGRDRSAVLWPVLVLGLWLEGAGVGYATV